jgi:hypothetical protein
MMASKPTFNACTGAGEVVDKFCAEVTPLAGGTTSKVQGVIDEIAARHPSVETRLLELDLDFKDSHLKKPPTQSTLIQKRTSTTSSTTQAS